MSQLTTPIWGQSTWGIRVEVPDFNIHHTHDVNMPPIQLGPILLIAGLFLLFQRRNHAN